MPDVTSFKEAIRELGSKALNSLSSLIVPGEGSKNKLSQYFITSFFLIRAAVGWLIRF